MRIVELSLRRRVTVAMAAIALVLFGLVAFGRLPINLLPELSYPSLTVETRFPGAAPAEVEALISRPIEEVAGVVNGVQRLTSTSRPGLSEVTLEFGWGRDMSFAALDVRQKLELLALPKDATKPVVLRFDPANDPVLRAHLTGGADLYELRYLAEEVLKKDLESTEGVAAIQVHGGYEEEIEVHLDEQRLALLGLDIREVADRLLAENVNQAGGSLYEEEARYLVRTRNEFESLDDIRQTVLRSDGDRRVTVDDIATVALGHRERSVATRYGGAESVELAFYKEGDANTVQVVRRVRQRLENLRSELPESVAVEFSSDQSRFIQASIDEVLQNALIGGLIAIVVLLLFLKDLRSTLVIGVSIPVSVIATFFLMYRTGTSLNVMSLGGLALGVGMLVDNAIVVLEAIVRHREAGLGPFEAAQRGASEVGGAVIASTLTTVAVFLPVVFLEGVAAQLFRDQALTVSFSLLASLVVSLTVIPALAATIGRRRASPVAEPTGGGRARRAGRAALVTAPGFALRAVRRGGAALGRGVAFLCRPVSTTFDAAFSRLEAAYPRALQWSLRSRFLVLGTAAGLLLVAAALVPRLGVDLIPTVTQGQLAFQVELPEGTPLASTDRFLTDASAALAELSEVDAFASIAGGAGLSLASTGTEGENVGRIEVQLIPGAGADDEERVIEALRRRFADNDQARFELQRPATFTFRPPIEVELFGDRLEELFAAASRVQQALAGIPGLVDVATSTELGNPELQITFDRDKLARLGLDAGQAIHVLRAKLQGEVATRFTDHDRQIDVRIRALAAGSASIDDVARLAIAQRDGRPVSLGSVASIQITDGPTEVRRIGQRRAAVVSGSLAGRDMGAVAADVQTALAGLALPATVTAKLSGQEEEMQRSFRSLALAMALAVFLVYLVMASQFESFLHPFVILFTLPLGAVGVVGALALTGGTVNVVALIGVVMLAGIVVNNAIVLIDAINQRRRAGASVAAALREAGSSRLRPILMTTATTVGGLLPMALGLGEGAELRAPLAITVIGGLSVATALTLLVIPVTYSLFARWAPTAEAASEAFATADGPADEPLASQA